MLRMSSKYSTGPIRRLRDGLTLLSLLPFLFVPLNFSRNPRHTSWTGRHIDRVMEQCLYNTRRTNEHKDLLIHLLIIFTAVVLALVIIVVIIFTQVDDFLCVLALTATLGC
jgi:hypothetical protein